MPYSIYFKEVKMSYSDVEHVMTMMSGCESLLNGDPKSADASYAFTVLKLHAADAGFVAGQEGFMDAVKKGAAATIEWVKKLIRAIRDYMRGVSKEDRERIGEIDRKLKELSKIDEYKGADVFDGLKDMATVLVQRLELIEKDTSGIDFDFPKIDTLIEKAKDIVDYMEGDESKDIGAKLESLRAAIDNVLTQGTTALDKQINVKPNDDKKLTDSEKFASTALKNLTSSKEALSRLIDKTVIELTKAYTRFRDRQEDRSAQRDNLNREKDKLDKK